MRAQSIFRNSDDLPRSGWRFFIFVLAYLLFAPVLGLLAAALAAAVGVRPADGPAAVVISRGFGLAAALLTGWICARLLEMLPFRSLGASFVKNWYRNFAVGFVIGSATLVAAIAPPAVAGAVAFSPTTLPFTLVTFDVFVSLSAFAVAAAFEEALFRGYILQTFSRSGLAWLAIVITSVFFGTVHLANPNANFISTINTILAGIWLSVAYLKTRDLWFAFGVHLAWNWTQGSIFGIEVSGLTDLSKISVLTENDFGPAWMTGGSYGIEASIFCTLALLASIAAIHYLPWLGPTHAMLKMTSPAEEKAKASATAAPAVHRSEAK